MENYFDVCWVCFPLRDGVGSVHGELAQARHRFFTGARKPVRVDSSQTLKGFEGRIRGRISRRSFYWKKSAKGASGGGVTLEEAFGQKDGWVLVTRDLLGVIVSRTYFDKEQRWIRSEYYEPWDSGSPRVIFLPGEDRAIIERQDWDGEKFRAQPLHTAPYRSGTAAQSLVDAQFGQPQLILTTTKGELCCCSQAEAEERAKALDSVTGGTMVLMPAWEIKEGAFPVEEGEEDTAVTFTSLEEYARIEAPEKPVSPPPPAQALAQDIPHEEPPAPLPEEPVQTDELDLEFILADARQADAGEAPMPAQEEPIPEEPAPPVWEEAAQAVFAEPQPAEDPLPPEPDSAILPVVREAMEQRAEISRAEEPACPAFHGEPSAPVAQHLPKRAAANGSSSGVPVSSTHASSVWQEEQPSMSLEDTSILSAARQAGGGNPPKRAQQPARSQPSMSLEDTAILSAARQANGGEPPRRTALGESPSFSGVRQPQNHAHKSGPAIPRHAGPTSQPPAPPAARQNTPAPASPSGSDRMRAGKLTGKGRAEQPGGLTAYEGEYKDGKRQGFGSHYYKSGDLSYAGFWRNDKKDGLGVSFREGDHALHISRWMQGKPGQQVSLFDREGSLRYGGRIVGGKKEGAGVSISSADGSVLVTKWQGGQNTGLASAFDPDGNLLYYGSWKNGKRHGHGTEFDKNGGIVFDGEWRDDQYYNGILYQKPAEESQLTSPEYAEPDWEL